VTTTSVSGPPALASGDVGDGRVADPDRRFYAFAVDRLIAWPVDVVVAVVVTRTLIDDGHVFLGVAAMTAAVLLVGLVFAVLQGTTGRTPGKSLAGLRLLDTGSERPIGTRRAILRALVLGLAAVPFGFGLAALAWTSVADRSRLRRGWHDRLVSSIVVDVRPEPVAETTPDLGPRAVVNLTAMRLAPAHRLVGTVEPPTPARPPQHAAPRAWVRAEGSTSAWAVGFDTGERVDVDTLLLIGRGPDPRLGEQGARLVTLPSTDQSVSKTHLEVVVAGDGALVVTDRGSTNGSTLVRQGTPRHLSPGRATTLLEGDVVLLGDRRMHVVRRAV
jgi:uncharacterized RDD family membrane protein YckC